MKKHINKIGFIVCLLFLALPEASHGHFKTTPDSPVHITSEGKLEYSINERGDRVPDFSFCGYMASESPIPNVPVKVVVPVMQDDATAAVQAAIDYVSALPIDESGFRGTVLLKQGTYSIEGSLTIRSSGVVLRGSGCGETGTILLAAGMDRETLIRVAGTGKRKQEDPIHVASQYFPVNTTELVFENSHPFRAGDRIIVNRPSTQKWVEHIGADKIGLYVDYQLTKWEAGDFDMNWDREVVAVSPHSITLDVPLTNSLDPEFGGANVSKFTWDGQIRNVGIENLRCVSAIDASNSKDENHRWMAITMEKLSDGWVRRVVSENFVSSAVAVWETASRVTVEDCKSLSPVGEVGNFRRYAFQTLGQQVLFQRCYAEYAWHAFSVGFTTPGPNAFVQCYSYLPFSFSGAVGGWANGILFDKMTVDGGNISLAFRDVDGQGGGWSAANSLCWQCRAAQIHLSAPPDAQNWAYASWAQGYGNGHHELQHTFVKPESIFYAQLEARTGKKTEEEKKILLYDSNETTAPTPELSAMFSERSKTPDMTMNEWIDRVIETYPLATDTSGAHPWSWTKPKASEKIVEKPALLTLKNGWLVQDGQVAVGKRTRTSLWRGSTRPGDVKNAAPNLVRFVPGRMGRGLTDDLDTLAADMVENGTRIMQHFPALWYERRRDDHARTRRADADVWAPFYEQPFSRSGQGEAFDRLSKYDLNKWNTWYWLRLKKFANIAGQNSLLLIQEHYLQHNIIEEGAHWADYPWRTANNINQLGFAENTYYAGDKRVYMAEEFYDTTNMVLNRYHRQYIRKNLDNLKDNENIIHHLGWEYTGPVHFVQFWLDVIAEWENENKQDVLVMLPGTKDVQDAILADPKRSSVVDIIDVIQWHYRKDGSLYAPEGGVSLAGRQYARLSDPGETSFDQVYRAISGFHQVYPEKAIVYSQRLGGNFNWAVFMGGGSLTSIPVQDKNFLKDAEGMEQMAPDPETKQYALGKPGKGYIIFCGSPELKINLSNDKKNYRLKWIDPSTGNIQSKNEKVSGGEISALKSPFEGASVAWLKNDN